tara:strand:- start:36 stop:500 length:465 start_codon:yes stop_codon:yes gene_type:complete
VCLAVAADRGLDVVPELIRQLNAGEGSFLVGGRRRPLRHADRVEIEPFRHADLTQPPPPELSAESGGHGYDIALSHHVLMHTRLAGIERHIAFWEALRVRWVVVDSWPSDAPNAELPRRPPAYRTVDVRLQQRGSNPRQTLGPLPCKSVSSCGY